MRKFNFLSKSSSRSCGHNVVTLASTVGSQEEFYVSGGNSRGAFTPADVCQTSSVRLNRFTAHRRGTMLKLLAFMLLFMLGSLNVWGAETAATMTAGTNGSICTVNNADGIKVGTSSKGGDMKVTVPSGATVLHVYAAAWKGVSGLSLNISGATTNPTSIALTADDGISNNSPFTLSGNASNFKFDISLSNISAETTITFTSSTTKRFVVWGATYETSSGGTPQPTVSADPEEVTDVVAAGVNNQSISLSYDNISGYTTEVSVHPNADGTGTLSPAWLSASISSPYSTVTYTVDENTGNARTAYIKVHATASGNKVAETIIPVSQVKYTAPTGTFNKFTGATLIEGDYVITYNTYTLANSVNSNRWINGDAIENNAASITNPDAAVIWHLSKSGNYWLLYNADADKYAAGTSKKNEGSMVEMPTENNEPAPTNLMKWTATVNNSTWQFENYGRSQASSDSGNKWLRNNGSNGWACYSTQTGGALTLYKKALPTHVVTFTAAPTGGAVAVSVGSSAINTNADVEEGATVTITPTASQYYQIASVTKGGVAITPVQGVYSFTMPSSDVAIAVTFELIPVTAVTLNKSQLELIEGATETLSVSSVTPNTARSTVTWSSTNTNVATVTSAGVVTAKAAGSATIKATSTVTTSVFGSCALTVSAPSGNPITISQTTGGTVTANIVDLTDVLAGTSVTLTATPSDGYSFNSWTVLDDNLDDITPTSQTANTFTFDMPDGEVLAEASFTHEEAVLKLHDADGESTYDSGNTHYWKESVTLPDNAAACSKTFMGWSADADRSTAPEIAKGASYTIPNKGTNHLYAVYAATEDEDVTITPSAVSDGDDPHTITIDQTGYTLSANKNNGSSAPTWNSTNSDVRIYAKGDITLASSTKTMKSIVFNLSAQGLKRLAPITASEGTIETQTSGDETVTWTGSATSVTFTVGDNADYGSEGSSKAGQLDFSTIDVAVAGTPSSYSTTCAPQVAAPTFSVDAGMYTEGQTIHISAVEGATIYYTTNGNDPTTSSDVFGEDIVLSARAITTVKAIAVKAGYENSNVASAVYNINLPFTVAEAIAEIPTPGDQRAKTYIDGIVCTAATSISSGAMTYYISDDGTETSRIRIYNGKGLDNADFSATSDLKVGDKVRVYGLLNNYSGSYDVDDSYLTSLVTATVSSIEIGGTATKTAYTAGDNTFSYAGLTATANYSNTGYSKDVTNEVTWKAAGEEAYEVTATGNINVTATLGNVTSDPKVVAVTYTTKTVASLRLEYASTYTFVGFDLPKPKVYASFEEDIPEEEVTELLTDDNYDTEDAYDKNEAGNYTIKVAYKSKEATYTVTVKAIYNTQETAHSVADAIEIIKKSTYTSTSADPTAMYVRGFVCTTGTPNNNGQLTYYINDTEEEEGRLQVYQGKYFENASFDSNNNLAKGDEVIIEGHMLYYNSATPELKLSPLVYLLKKALPTISVEDVDEMEVGQADLAVSDLEISKDGNGEVTLVSNDESKATIVDGKIHAVAAGEVTVTANLAATDNTGSINYKANSTTFNVHVIAARTRYTVTFDANGADGGSAPEAIANQLEGATVELPECTYTWAHHGFTGWKVINLSTSAVIEVENNRFTMPAANVKIQAQWEEIATTHIVFNVNGNTETVAAVDVPQEVEYSITQETDGQNGYEFVGWAESSETEDVEEAIATIESYTPKAGEANKTLYAVFKRVDEGAPKTDVLTAADLPSASGYTTNTGVTKISDAVYTATTAVNNSNIQLNSNSNPYKGIISTTAGGVLKNISVVWGSSSNTLDIYASNTAYTEIGDMWDNAKKGTKVKSFTATGSYDFTDDYSYIGIRSNNNAIYLSSISITWQPKTTYYTTAPSAVYAVSYVLGEGGAWEGDACEGANVKAGQTFDICENVPVREHYKFVKWQVAGEDVSGTITINAETAITAVWEAKVESNITYNAGTGSGSDAVVGNNEEAAEIVLPSAADKSLSKEGYNFVGWLYGGDLYEAGQTFEMPASAVTFVAQWKKQNITKMTLVTDVAQLVDGSKVVIVSKDPVSNSQTKSSAIAGPMSGNNKFFASVTDDLTFNNDNTISYNAETAIELTLDKVEGGWALRSGDNYLAHVSGQNQVKWQSDIAVWSISFSGNNATIKYSNNNYSIQYNASSGSERFSAYSGSQNAVQLYASVTAVTENASISDLGYVEGDVIVVNSGATLTMDAPSAPASITVKEDAVVNVSAATEAGTVIVEKGAKLVIEEGGSVTTNEPLVLYTTLGKGAGTNSSGNAPGSSSEIINAERLNATGDVYLEIELTQDEKASEGWYAFSVPFKVDALNGVYYGDTKLQNEVGYAIMSHYGDLRAENKYAWKKFRGIMEPGVFYVITVGHTNYKTLRFKKVAGEALVASTDVAVSEFPSQTGNDADGAWNGIGNPNLQISNLATSFSAPMQFYDHKTNSFTSRNHSMNLVVGSAFFIQYDATSTVSIPVGTTLHNGYLAPQREHNADEDAIYEVSLTNMTTGEMEDNLFLTAREDATNEYEIGRDLAKMSMGTAKCAQMWVPAYGTKLCAADFPLVNSKATYPLMINTVQAGTYTIEQVRPQENAELYLTKNGHIIWNLTMSPCELDLNQGQNEGYGLILRANAPSTATGVDNDEWTNGEWTNVQKVIIDEKVYILRGGKMYGVDGKEVR